MKSLTSEQWERVWSLEGRFQGLPPEERPRLLAELWEQGQEDSPVLSLLEQVLELPTEPIGGPTDAEAPRGWRCGDFTILETLGRGGMGVVYLAEQQISGGSRKVALKLVRPQRLGGSAAARRFFEQEMRNLSALEYQGIARLYAGGVCPGPDGTRELLYFAMEYIDGVPLDRFAADAPVRDRLALFVRLCRALEYAHANHVIHCDLKPGNILVTRDSDGVALPHVLDFGLSWVYGSDDQPPVGCGTLPYMSPEQMDGRRYGDLSKPTDVYALGLILYEFLAGRHPFQEALSGSSQELRTIMLNYPPPPLGNYCDLCQGELEAVVMKALAKEPEQRWQRVDTFRAALQDCMSALSEPGISAVQEHGAGNATKRPDSLTTEDSRKLTGLFERLDVFTSQTSILELLRSAFAGHQYGPDLLKNLNLNNLTPHFAAGKVARYCYEFGEVSPGHNGLGVLLRYIVTELVPGDPDKRSLIESVLRRYGI